MESRKRADRFAVTMTPLFFSMTDNERGMWHETPEEIEAGLEWGRKKAELLRWVKRKMGRRLTKEERRYMELYYFQGLTYMEVAKATGVSVATAHRAVARSIKKLQESLKRARSTEVRAARKASRTP